MCKLFLTLLNLETECLMTILVSAIWLFCSLCKFNQISKFQKRLFDHSKINSFK